jgi:hypothetical protein
MQFTGTLIVLLAFLPVAGHTTPAPQPTPLEAFVKQPASRIAWSSEAGRIDSKEGHAVITALVVEDSAQPPDRLRGVRIDLSGPGGKDQVYLGEETLPAFKAAFDEISQDAARGCSGNSGELCPPNLFVSAALFWYGDAVPNVHTLTAGHYFQRGSTGQLLSTIVDSDCARNGSAEATLNARHPGPALSQTANANKPTHGLTAALEDESERIIWAQTELIASLARSSSMLATDVFRRRWKK